MSLNKIKGVNSLQPVEKLFIGHPEFIEGLNPLD